MSETNSADKKADDNTESAETIADIDQFVNPKSWPVFILSGLLGLPVILVLFAVFQIRVGDLSAHPLKAAFIVYLGLYIGMCVLYFWSKSGPQIVQVGSLRRLLLSMSTDWTDADTADNDESEKLALEKAKTTITSVAMLISVAFLQLMQINSFYQDVLAAFDLIPTLSFSNRTDNSVDPHRYIPAAGLRDFINHPALQYGAATLVPAGKTFNRILG